MDFLKDFLTKRLAWAQAILVGLLAAVQQYFATASPDASDPVANLLTGAVLALVVRLIGALISKLGPSA